MTLIALALVLLYHSYTVQGRESDWSTNWGWSRLELNQLTDDQLIDLLYSDPERLRRITLESLLEEEKTDNTLATFRPPLATHSPGMATSYMRVHHFTSSKSPGYLASYSTLIVH